MDLPRPADDLSGLATLEPGSQAEVLTRLAQEARLVRLALDDPSAAPGLRRVAHDFERALGATRMPVLTAVLSADGALRA